VAETDRLKLGFGLRPVEADNIWNRNLRLHVAAEASGELGDAAFWRVRERTLPKSLRTVVYDLGRICMGRIERHLHRKRRHPDGRGRGGRCTDCRSRRPCMPSTTQSPAAATGWESTLSEAASARRSILQYAQPRRPKFRRTLDRQRRMVGCCRILPQMFTQEFAPQWADDCRVPDRRIHLGVT
jgi:hypothetical protein